jgi:IS5 family transposase
MYGSISRIRGWRRPSTTRCRCAGLRGIDLGAMPVPDESTVCRFRHLLERRELGKKLFQQVQGYLERQGIKIGTGTIVDATIISAPPSTKNKGKSRDPDMHQMWVLLPVGTAVAGGLTERRRSDSCCTYRRACARRPKGTNLLSTGPQDHGRPGLG